MFQGPSFLVSIRETFRLYIFGMLVAPHWMPGENICGFDGEWILVVLVAG